METTTAAMKITAHRKITDDDCRNHGILASDYSDQGTPMLATFENGQTVWYVANNDGTFWAMAFNDDEVFNSADEAALWVYRQMNA